MRELELRVSDGLASTGDVVYHDTDHDGIIPRVVIGSHAAYNELIRCVETSGQAEYISRKRCALSLARAEKLRMARLERLVAVNQKRIDRLREKMGLSPKNVAAVSLGKLGGQKGGKARAAKLSPARRAEIGKLAAAARWGRKAKG